MPSGGARLRRARKRAGECGANDVGASASGHDFLTGRQKSRAHGGCFLTATATAIALLEVLHEGFVFGGIGQHGGERKRAGRVENAWDGLPPHPTPLPQWGRGRKCV